jgi:hypothetical protein
MINPDKIREVMEQFGYDELTAWRHLRDREILRRQYRYRLPGRYQGAVEFPKAKRTGKIGLSVFVILEN